MQILSLTEPAKSLAREESKTGESLKASIQGSVLLVAVVCLAFIPATSAGFVWDDDRYVTANPLLTQPDGLKQIWFSAHRVSQYFPLVYTTFMLERALWGLNAMGFHIVNIALHAANVVLVWVLLKQIKVPGAWLAAAIFGVHPVQVETVAWITELKNTESTLFYLLVVLLWIKFIQNKSKQDWRLYVAMVILYAMALLSKTTACTLPAVMLIVVWLKGEPVTRRMLMAVCPFALLGIASGLLSIWWERHLGSYDTVYALSFSGLERLQISTRAFWFYLTKLFWPVNLTFSYARWDVNPREWTQYIWAAALFTTSALMWHWRRAIGRGPTAAAVFFVAVLSPLLGLIPLYTFRYSFVADHYQYLACLGPIALFSAALASQFQQRFPNHKAAVIGSILLLAPLSATTWTQALAYKDEETLWRDTATKNPASWMAWNYLGIYAEKRGDIPQAEGLYRKSIGAGASFEALNNLGKVLVKQGRTEEGMREYRRAIAMNPAFQVSYENLAAALVSQGRLAEAAVEYRRGADADPRNAYPRFCLAAILEKMGSTEEAISQYRVLLKGNVAAYEPFRNLASILSSDPNPDHRSGPEAIELALEACRRTNYQDAYTISVLARAYAECGRFDEALEAIEKAHSIASAARDADGMLATKKLQELFRCRQPCRDVPEGPDRQVDESARGDD